MGLAIVSFVVQMILLISTEAIGVSGKQIKPSFAWFVLISFIICTIISIGCIFYNSTKIRNYDQRGKHVAGLVFSIVGTAMGAIFLVSFMVGFLAAI